MSQREHIISGIAAIALAVLFPSYWIFSFSQSLGDFEASLRENLSTLDFSDLLFLIIGALEVYVYLSLHKVLKDFTNTAVTQSLLLILCGVTIVFHSTLIFDFYLALTHDASSQADDALYLVATFIAVGSLIVQSVIGVVFAIVLMIKAKEISSLILAFSVVYLIMCALQLTVIFSFVNVFLFPVALVVLAIHFFNDRNSVEVV